MFKQQGVKMISEKYIALLEQHIESQNLIIKKLQDEILLDDEMYEEYEKLKQEVPKLHSEIEALEIIVVGRVQ